MLNSANNCSWGIAENKAKTKRPKFIKTHVNDIASTKLLVCFITRAL